MNLKKIRNYRFILAHASGCDREPDLVELGTKVAFRSAKVCLSVANFRGAKDDLDQTVDEFRYLNS